MARGGYRLSQEWDPLILRSAQEQGINPNLLRGILWQESNFDPKQTGPMTHIGTAKGIAQLTPDTQNELGVTDPYDPNQAIPAAARYLAKYRQVGVDKGAANPDAYAAMVYYGGPDFKVTNRPAPGVPGPSVQGYATSVLNHAVNFAGLAGGTAPSTAQLGPPAGSQPAAGPLHPNAPPGLQPTGGPLPTNWADVPGAPASMRYAPPSMYSASSPEEATLYREVSTPQGYEAAVRALAGAGTASPASQVTEDPARSVATVLPPRNLAAPSGPVAGPGTVMPPAGGSQSWAGIVGPPGSPSGPGVAAPGPGEANLPPAGTPYGQAVRANIAQYGPMVGPDLQPARGDTLTTAPTAPQRALTDEAIGKMGPEDVFGVVMNENLTDADRSALNDRLTALQQQLGSGGR